jgi:hypothetical protein
MLNNQLRKFLQLIAIAAIIVLVAAALLTAGIYASLGEPDFSRVESPFLVAKDRDFRADSSLNTAFLGSSVTFRQINPAIFDAELSEGHQVRSYNLGNDGLLAPRSIDYLAYLLRTAPPNLETIFVELYRLDEILTNYDSPEIMHATGYRENVEIFQTVLAANFPKRYKLWLFGQYARSLVFKALGFRLVSYYSTERQLKPWHIERLAVAERGFYAKDIELAQSSQAENVATLESVRATLYGHPEQIEPRRQLHVNKYQQKWTVNPNPFTDRLLALIEQAKKKGIHLVFVFPPLADSRGINFAYPVWLALPPTNRIDLSDPQRYPELYEYSNLFDLEHVNSTGAQWFTRYLAVAYRSQLKAAELSAEERG